MTPTRKAAPTKLAAFRLEPELLAGLAAIRERDGILIAFQVRQAIRAWLESKGIVVKTERKRAATRKRP